MPKKYSFTDEQIEEIEQAIKKCKNKNTYKKLECLKLRAVSKKKLQEIAEITGYNNKYVSQIISKYHNDGLKEILENKYTGNRRKLTIDEEKELLAPFLNEAAQGKMLVVSDIRKAYEQATGEKSATATIYYILARHGWRKIMPRSKHPNKATDEAIEAYKKNQ